MDIRKLTPFVSVSPQISPDEVKLLAAAGFKAIINNRPDDEVPGQPAHASLKAAAEAAGLAYRHIPVRSGALSEENVLAMQQALEQLEGPVLAFCRSGTRSATLWALAEAGRVEPAAIIELAANAGYDLGGLGPALQMRAKDSTS